MSQQATPEQISAAREIYQNTDLQIDDDALISEAEEGSGYWVQSLGLDQQREQCP